MTSRKAGRVTDSESFSRWWLTHGWNHVVNKMNPRELVEEAFVAGRRSGKKAAILAERKAKVRQKLNPQRKKS